MKTKMMFMLAFAAVAALSQAGDLHVYLHQGKTPAQKQNANPVTEGARPYDALSEQFNQGWPFGQESNQD